MSQFNDREKAYENKFAHDYEMDFKARAKRNKMLGRWAAEKMAMTAEDAESYAEHVMKECVDGVANETIVTILLRDLRDKGLEITEDEIKAEMDRLHIITKEELK